ncbi:hypothetical protein GCM10009039_34480 [Halocalculus aciditolerans]|uniref:Phage integrase family protein n=2 Tax=Halocalculus aciditolerans TaxID=1383812 RepID=A0A830F8F2_9EURY|nr:hypothetical protein GCM10009039_34480 [Halocalculus aciditolerans]
MKCWLSTNEQEALLATVENDTRRELAMSLGLCGLRTAEIEAVERRNFRRATSADGSVWKVAIEEGKTGDREVPVPQEVRDLAERLANSAGLRKDEPLVGRATRTLRSWMEGARNQIADSLEDDGRDDDAEEWREVGMHDLRRTWATDTYYKLAMANVPIAETLVMGWGGWVMNEKGRETFREEYLGPEPDFVAVEASDVLGLGASESASSLLK